ncbi:iron-sulfur cluster-binding domain-containing protein [Panacibacter ginsenosidivorans]|uniref:Iron-sulfur cluster-binding domain-containing protein n=1 Tax=Panacibacter ginsenosidivorans TaxID=1813871 RepID=A0A5B8V695_9BACT|nr:iron-sulfur cluster-binding domain-containing protein [Panacibacter ginsenosidivorans]QEC66960.1 iron-sulfur cluster-binding domain-containing protein [Panacibacter ginsenosidivorans]
MDTSVLQKVKVADIIVETALTKTFVLQPLNGWQPHYQPGQFITLLFYNTGTEKRRSFSLTSNPLQENFLSITVKRVVNGEYSRYMLDHVLNGDEFYTTGISGFFILPKEKPANIKQILFLAAGSGITPVYTLIRAALQKWNDVSITLIYSNRHENDVIFFEALQFLQKQHSDRFKIEFLFSDNINIHKARLSNYLLNILLKKYKVEANNALFYMCGPFDYMLMIQITLLSYGVPMKSIYKEQFSTLPRIVKPVPPDTGKHNATIHIGHTEYELSVQYPSTILAVAKSQNIMLPYSCEAGRCGSCTAKCTSGKVWMAYNEVLTDDEIAKGCVLVCQAYPVGGDVVIEYE